MKIHGIEGMTYDEVRGLVAQGGKFVMLQYCVSVVLMTFRRPTDIRFVKPGESLLAPQIGWSALTLLVGWWGIPWGPVYTIQSVWVNLTGGRDVTQEVLQTLAPGAPQGEIRHAPGVA